jgi:hypothetical protein
MSNQYSFPSVFGSIEHAYDSRTACCVYMQVDVNVAPGSVENTLPISTNRSGGHKLRGI